MERLDTNVISSYPSPSDWQHANERQRNRALRSFEEMRKRAVPVYSGPLFVSDDDEVETQSPQDVARRTMVLWAVELRAEGVPRPETLGILDRLELWDSVSPLEKDFLRKENPSQSECRPFVWRLESIWVLLWSLGYLERLDWPTKMCDVPRIAKILGPCEADPEFINSASLRPKSQILDNQDLIMRLRWAIRNAFLNEGGMLPVGLDWLESHDRVPVTMSAEVGIVEQRHHTLNWLVNFLDPIDWDSVDTPT
jgi:hypothetical protein